MVSKITDKILPTIAEWQSRPLDSVYPIVYLNALGVCNDKNRGVEDILIACKDGLAGFSEAINTVFPKTEIQLCVIHQIRNSLKYVPYKEQKEFMVDLKKIYQALTLQEAELAFEQFKEKWGKKHSIIILSWEKNWTEHNIWLSRSAILFQLRYKEKTDTHLFTKIIVDNSNSDDFFYQ